VTNWMTQTFSFTSDTAVMNQIETTPTYVSNEGKEVIGVIDKTNQINFYQSYYNENLKLKELNKWYDLSFSEAYEGLTVVDKNGIMAIFKKAYSRYIGLYEEEAVRRVAADVIEDTRMPVVLQTGLPERSRAHKLGAARLLVH